MFKGNLKNNHLLILVSFIPLSVLIGASISLINVFLILFSFLYYFKSKDLLLLFKNKAVISLLLVYFYLLLNSIISIDYTVGFFRNFGFFRFILLFFAVNYLFFKNENTNFLFVVWSIILFIVLLDSYFEFYVGKNILGYSDTSTHRIVSFFRDEPIVAGYLNGFIFIIFGFLFSKYENRDFNKKIFIYFIILSFFFCILITGERSNTLKFLFGLFVFMSLNHFIKFKFKLFFVLFSILLLSISYLNSEKIKLRYGGQLINLIDNKEKRKIFFEENIYMKLYKSGIQVFKDHPTFGVGNKNYRVKACGENLSKNYICNTHPHQIYIEFLSEHGLIGSIFLLSIIFFLIFRNFKIMIESKNLIQLGSFCYLITNFLPILPSGSFFGDFNATLFWLNFSIFYASNPKTNIYKNGGLAQ